MPEINDDPRPLADIVREYVIAVCEFTNWNLVLAARVLGVTLKTVYNHLHRYAAQGYLRQVQIDRSLKREVWQRQRQQ